MERQKVDIKATSSFSFGCISSNDIEHRIALLEVGKEGVVSMTKFAEDNRFSYWICPVCGIISALGRDRMMDQEEKLLREGW